MELKGTFVRRGSGLFPANAMAEEELRQFPQEDPVRVHARTTRSARQLNMCWGLATLVAEGMGEMADKEDGMELLCVRAHHMKFVTNPITGEVTVKRKSIANLGKERFTRLINRFIWTIRNEVFAEVDKAALRSRFEEILRGDKDLPEHLKAFDDAANESLGRKVA